MNLNQRGVMTILTLARIVESTLWYILPNPNGFSKAERDSRYQALKGLTAEGTPFFENCKSNGDVGKEIKENMDYFIEDVYAPEGRIVTVDIHDAVHVEQSLLVDLFTSIIKVRAALEAFLLGGIDFLKNTNSLEEKFEKLVLADIKYYHAFASKVSCILIANKFMELNTTANTYAESYSKSHGGINPNQDPEFDVRKDPSFRMVENEFHVLNQAMLDVMNTYPNEKTPEDPEFVFAREQTFNDCDIFTGKKQTTDLNAFFNNFSKYFDKIIEANQNPVNEGFRQLGDELREFEAKLMAEAKEKEGAGK